MNPAQKAAAAAARQLSTLGGGRAVMETIYGPVPGGTGPNNGREGLMPRKTQDEKTTDFLAGTSENPKHVEAKKARSTEKGFEDALAASSQVLESYGLRFHPWTPGEVQVLKLLECRTVATPGSEYSDQAECMVFEVIAGPDKGRKIMSRSIRLLENMHTQIADTLGYRGELRWRVQYNGLRKIDGGKKAHDFSVTAYGTLPDGAWGVFPWARERDEEGRAMLAQPITVEAWKAEMAARTSATEDESAE